MHRNILCVRKDASQQENYADSESNKHCEPTLCENCDSYASEATLLLGYKKGAETASELVHGPMKKVSIEGANSLDGLFLSGHLVLFLLLSHSLYSSFLSRLKLYTFIHWILLMGKLIKCML